MMMTMMMMMMLMLMFTFKAHDSINLKTQCAEEGGGRGVGVWGGGKQRESHI